MSIRPGVPVTTEGFRGKVDEGENAKIARAETNLRQYANAANNPDVGLAKRATGLAASILAHDVFMDGNGRTAILAIYKLYELNKKALSIEPYIIWTALVSDEDNDEQYKANIVRLEKLLTDSTVEISNSHAVQLAHAIGGVARLQAMRGNWAEFRAADNKAVWKAGQTPTGQADVRRMNKAIERLDEYKKPHSVLDKKSPPNS